MFTEPYVFNAFSAFCKSGHPKATKKNVQEVGVNEVGEGNKSLKTMYSFFLREAVLANVQKEHETKTFWRCSKRWQNHFLGAIWGASKL